MIYMSILQLFLLGTLSTPYKFLHMTSYHTQWKLNKYNPNKIQVVPLSYIRQNNKVTSTISSGIDEKYKKTDDTETLFDISLNQEKKRVLSILLDDNVLFVKKLELLVCNRYLLDYEGFTSSIKSGGLYDDYNFEEF